MATTLRVFLSLKVSHVVSRGLRRFGQRQKITLRGFNHGPPNKSLQVSRD
jgi:hypothetical protein